MASFFIVFPRAAYLPHLHFGRELLYQHDGKGHIMSPLVISKRKTRTIPYPQAVKFVLISQRKPPNM